VSAVSSSQLSLSHPVVLTSNRLFAGLNVTVQLPIISVKKNPQQQLYTTLGVLTRGTIIEVYIDV
jgi:ribosomal protein S8E